MPSWRILDLDNCVANDGWRIPRINWSLPRAFDRYHEYHLLAPWDEVGNADLFNVPERIIILTSRPVLYRAATVEWLRRRGVPYTHLIMRNNWDHRPSLQVKRGQVLQLSEYGVDRRDITVAFDDRPEVCAMYRELGIDAHVRALHAVDAYLNPLTGINHADGSKVS